MLIYFTPERLMWNSTMYENSYVPDHYPGGGGFGVTQFTLESLYDLHMLCRNWWTNSNQDLPLTRYRGCKLYFYQAEKTDYIVRYSRVLPTNSNKLTYPACQPSILLMHRNSIKVPCRENKKLRKGYKSVFIPPPTQFQSKWYFQQDLYKVPLVLLHAAAASFQNYYLNPLEKNNTVTFNFLNTFLIQNRNFENTYPLPWACKFNGTLGVYLYYSADDPPKQNGDDVTLANLICLADCKHHVRGSSANDLGLGDATHIEEYIKNLDKHWGNVFHEDIHTEPTHIYYSYQSPIGLKTAWLSKKTATTWKQLHSDTTNANLVLTPINDTIFKQTQYVTQQDSGLDTVIYLSPNNKAENGWEKPQQQELLLDGLPIWFGLYGFIDFQKKQKKITNIDTQTVLTFKSTFTFPKYHYPFVPIDETFLQGHSPYTNTLNNADKNSWYPMIQYQQETLNDLVKYGPCTPKPNVNSENIRMYYKFYFQWGGSPAKMVNVENPAHQDIYPIPRNINETTSLQNPAQPPETIVYSFDQRHDSLTRRALQRISEDWSTYNLFSSITEPTTKTGLQQAFADLEMQEVLQEKEEKKIQIKLQQLREQQQSIRQSIMTMLSKIQ